MLKQLRAHFGGLPLGNAGEWVVAVDGYRAKKGHLSDKTVANHLTLLGSVLRLARDLDWLDRLPRIKKPSVKLNSADYRYLRNKKEIDRFLQAALGEGPTISMLYRTAVCTGMRAGELAAVEWTDVDLDIRLITVSKSFDGPTKSDRVRRLPILDVLLPHLQRWRSQHPGPLLFTNRDGNMLGRSARAFQEVLHRVLSAAGFPKVMRRGKERNYVCFHDLRHTFASAWVQRGGNLFKLKEILGHSSIQVTQRYAHLQPELYSAEHGLFGSAEELDETALRPSNTTPSS